MKILHVVAYYKPAYVYGGPVFSVGSLCEGLSRLGHQVCVYTTLANGPIELDLEPGKKYDVEGVEVRYFKRKTYDLSHFSPGLLRQLWKDAKKYDIVHISGWWNLVSVLGAIVCLMRGVKPIVSLRGMLGPYSFSNGKVVLKKAIHTLIGGYLLSRSTLHATVNQELREAECIVRNAKGFVLPNFLELPAFRNGSRPDNNRIEFIFLGRVHHKKNLELLFTVLSEVSHPWHLKIAGTGDAKYISKLRNLAENLGIKERTTWVGHLDTEKKFQALAESDVMVLLSHAENFANTVVESLSVGTAVFLSDRVGMAEYVADNSYGKVVHLDRQESIESLNALVEDKALLLRTFEDAPRCVREDFSSDKLIEKYVLNYQKLCRN